MDEPRIKRCKGIPLWLQTQLFIAKWTRGGDHYGHVHFLSCGRVAKLFAYPHELEAMQFVLQRSSIRVPRVHRVYRIDNPDHNANGRLHIVMEELPGKPLGHVIHHWTPQQADVFARDLAHVIEQLRQLEPPPAAKKRIGSAAGGVNRDGRLSCHPFGPFNSVTAFHTYLRRGRPLDHWGDRPTVIKVHERPEDHYSIKFAHSDLVPKNILVDGNGHITGIVDWEFAGWYPEYWEYTKAYYTENRPIYDSFYDAVDHAFTSQPGINKYSDELACEQTIWMRFTPFEYCDPPWQHSDNDNVQGDGREGDVALTGGARL